MAIFSLFACLQIMNIVGFIFQQCLLCHGSFFGCIFGGVVVFLLMF
jgi:hypothetical protein